MKPASRMEDIEYRTTPRGMLYWSKEFFEAYKVIRKEKSHFIALYQVKFFLLCHAVELLLKSYLQMKGYKVVELRKKRVGHNLSRLIEMVLEKKEISISKKDHSLLCIVSESYSQKEFEYFERGYKEIEDIDRLENIFDTLLGKIDPLIQEDYLTKRRSSGT